MAAHSSIEWTDASWNPIRARNLKTGKIGWHCDHVSEGCRNCYAEGINKRLGTGLDYKPGILANGSIEIFLDETMLLAPLKWKRPRKIFIGSMTDLFARFVPDEMIVRVLDIVRRTSYDGGGGREHIYQVLTKRAERMAEFMPRLRFNPSDNRGLYLADDNMRPVIMKNLWLGISAERQQEADERIPLLLQTPAAVRFVSLEPLLGAIDLTDALCDGHPTQEQVDGPRGMHYLRHGAPRLDWVIVGGESGPHARPMHPDWARSLRDQCAAAGVPFFFKQWGEWADTEDWPSEMQEHLELVGKADGNSVRVGKKAAGRLLDGVEHSAFPSLSSV